MLMGKIFLFASYGYFCAGLRLVNVLDELGQASQAHPIEIKGEWLPKGSDGMIGFNPALTPLPDALRGEFDKSFPGAFYLLVCRGPGGNNTLPLRVLNKDFQELTTVSKSIVDGKDARLFTHNDKVLMTWVPPGKGGKDAQIVIQEVEVKTTGATLIGNAQYMNGKNIGLMSVNGNLQALTWLKPETEVHDVDIVLNKVTDGCAQNKEVQRALNSAPHSTGMMKNSINPILLPGGKQYLGVMHMYDSTNYYQHFVLFDASKPFQATHTSDAFCIPSSNPNEVGCESIQFVASGVLVSKWYGMDVVLTYGINDQKSAMVRMPLRAVLDFAKTRTLPKGISFLGNPHTEETECLNHVAQMPMVAQIEEVQI